MTSSTMRISKLGLICILAGHGADPARARWNAGICFGKCVRCGRDVVRSATGQWRVPRGYRVVWRPAMVAQVAPMQPVPVEMPQAATAPTRETLFERFKADVEAPLIDQEQPPASAEVDEAALPTEWPIAPAAADELEPSKAGPATWQPVPAPPEVQKEPSRPIAADFMDEVVEADDWDDFGDLRARGAYA